MLRYFYILIFSVVWLLFPSKLAAQEDIFSDLLKEEVEVIDPQYKPVLGLGIGTMNFFGDVSNNYYSPLLGNFGFKVNVATFVDSKNHYYRANFFLLYGTLSGEKVSYLSPVDNLNFRSNIINFGINIDYSFGHIYKQKETFLRPYISLGIESMQFNSKRDSLSAGGSPYYYWTDGTIRDVPETDEILNPGNLLERDYIYETDLRDEIDYGLEKYSQNAFAIPIDVGLEFAVSERVDLRVGYSLNYILSDKVDHVSHENKYGVIGDKANDFFTFTYVTMHLDLFSDPQTIMIEKLFADLDDFDYTMYDDEDYDMIWDGWDDCPGTPRGVAVDTAGCPFDDDQDGVPNYLDKELQTPKNAYVDNDGVQMTEDELVALLSQRSTAVDRDEVDLYIRKIEGYGKYFGTTYLDIPDKFKHLDSDGDEYISFDELLKAIDDFFEYESRLSPDDIYELNSFFFAQ